ncbi:hypothetical protein ACI2KR_31995 [Pseudomonas luteola]
MLYEFEIGEVSLSGNPKAYFSCKHCGIIDFNMDSYLYAAQLSTDPRKDIESACQEFIDRVNTGSLDMFKHQKTAAKLKLTLCHCDHKVVYLGRFRAMKRAQAILKAGLESMG